MDRLPFLNLNKDASQIRDPLLDLSENLPPRAALLPILELELNQAMGILGHAISLKLHPGTRGHRLDALHLQNTLLDGPHLGIHFLNREVAPHTHNHGGEIGLHLGEKFHPLAKLLVHHLHRNKGQNNRPENFCGMPGTPPQETDIPARETAQLRQVAALRGRQTAHRLLTGRPGLAPDRPKSRHKDQRHEQARR